MILSCSKSENQTQEENTSNITEQTYTDTDTDTDTDGDGVADSEDAWPLDSSISENLWGVINNEDVEFFLQVMYQIIFLKELEILFWKP